MKNSLKTFQAIKEERLKVANTISNQDNSLNDTVVYLKHFSKMLNGFLIEGEKEDFDKISWNLYCYYCLQELLSFLPAVNENFINLDAFITEEIKHNIDKN